MFTIFKSSKINKKGVLFVLFTAINAVITISLYKYNISNFNSVEAEQILINLIIMLYFYINARIVTKEHPFLLLKKTIYLLQSSTQGIAGVVESFAYLFAAPSIILTAKKSTSLIWSIFSGNIYFKEKHIAIKIIVLIFITFGLVLFVL
jgi:drug/metabolite transporter (DMT)-like permease